MKTFFYIYRWNIYSKEKKIPEPVIKENFITACKRNILKNSDWFIHSQVKGETSKHFKLRKPKKYLLHKEKVTCFAAKGRKWASCFTFRLALHDNMTVWNVARLQWLGVSGQAVLLTPNKLQIYIIFRHINQWQSF